MECDKKKYKDSRAARGAIRTISKSPNQGKKPIRAYLCPNCGFYHITSASKDSYEAEKKRRQPKNPLTNVNR